MMRDYQQATNTNKANTEVNQNSKKEDDYKIDIEPIEFDGLLKTKLTTTMTLGADINRLFRTLFSDYEGCVIAPNNYNGALEAVLYFKDKAKIARADGKFTAVIPRMEKVRSRENTSFSQIQVFNARTNTKQYDVTEEFKGLMAQFVNNHGKKPDWNSMVFELKNTINQMGAYDILVEVRGLDLYRILKKVYGDKNGDTKVDYNISLIRSIGAGDVGAFKNFLISIQQLDSKELEKLAYEVGMIPSMGSVPMIRG